MPILNVKVSAASSPELTRQISALLLDLTTRILDFVDRDCWIVGGRLLSHGGHTQEYRYHH